MPLVIVQVVSVLCMLNHFSFIELSLIHVFLYVPVTIHALLVCMLMNKLIISIPCAAASHQTTQARLAQGNPLDVTKGVTHVCLSVYSVWLFGKL